MVLIVEDEPFVRYAAVQSFQGAGAQTFDAPNGRVAIQILGAHPEINLLFTDLRMPGIGGYELIHRARALRPGLRIVLATANRPEGDVQGVAWLPKPYSDRDLARLVAEPG